MARHCGTGHGNRSLAVGEGSEMGRGMGLARTTVAWPATARKQSCRSPVRQSPPHGGGPGRVGLLCRGCADRGRARSEEHTSELQSLMRNSYAVFCLKKK